MAEKLCLQWNDYQDNVKKAFGHLRDTSDFVDVTLACEDGQQIEAHKVILAASSPFFQRILKGNKHSHPLIYMKGMRFDDLTAIVDFLYYGEANVYQENLDSFLAIAGELQLKGLEDSATQDGSRYDKQPKPMEKYKRNQDENPKTQQTEHEIRYDSNKIGNNVLALPKTSVSSASLHELDETVKAMMGQSENIIRVGKEQRPARVCKVCGKEGYRTDIMRHIESYHLEGVLIPCSRCDKMFKSRNSLRQHIKINHKEY